MDAVVDPLPIGAVCRCFLNENRVVGITLSRQVGAVVLPFRRSKPFVCARTMTRAPLAFAESRTALTLCRYSSTETPLTMSFPPAWKVINVG